METEETKLRRFSFQVSIIEDMQLVQYIYIYIPHICMYAIQPTCILPHVRIFSLLSFNSLVIGLRCILGLMLSLSMYVYVHDLIQPANFLGTSVGRESS